MRVSNERGIAMLTTLLVLMLMSALLVGFTAVVMTDNRYRFIDRDRGQAFYAASGGVEKLTADLGNKFFSTLAPTSADITGLTATTPAIPRITYTATAAPTGLPASSLSPYYCGPAPRTTKIVGTNGYTIMFCTDATGNPVATQATPIKSGSYEGLIAQQTPFQIDVTARTDSGGEVHLIRTMEAVAIPVFQFGMFSDVDLSFFAGPDFDFGGRVHTNGNLFLAAGNNGAVLSTLTLRDKVTAVKEVIRERLQNGVLIATSSHLGTVSMAKSPGCVFPANANCRPLARGNGAVVTEGSMVDGLTSAINDPVWHNVSLSTYNSWIRNGRTGAKRLDLPLLTVGGSNPDLIRRAPPGENVANPVLFSERLYSKASIRILLSDVAADITNLPTVTATLPVLLDGDWASTAVGGGRPAGYGPAVPAVLDLAHPPIARSMGPLPAVTTIAAALAVNAATITVNAMPAMFAKPPISVKSAGGVYKATFTCTTWTDTQFQNCNVPVNLTNGSTIYLANPAASTTEGPGLMPGIANNIMPGNANPTATLNGAVNASGALRTLILNANQTTWAFAANTFFVNDVGAGGSGRSMPVTCTGTNGAIFTGCTGLTNTTVANATVTTSYLSQQDTGTIGGYIKIEMQSNANPPVWTDVTMQVLNYGIGGRNLDGFDCGDPTPNAIVRIQRLRDNGGAPSCPIASTLNSYEWLPNMLFDPREGLLRDTDPGNFNLKLGGLMHYVAIDVGNLARWFQGTGAYAAPNNGVNAIRDTGGFTVYFSDRRNNRNAARLETAEYGWENFVNPENADGALNATLDCGEDVNLPTPGPSEASIVDACGRRVPTAYVPVLDVYGGVPNYYNVAGAAFLTEPPGAAAIAGNPLVAAARPTTALTRGQAQVNRAIIFRRALKLINGNNISGLGVTGLTIVSENPVYVHGDWNSFNAAGSTFGAAPLFNNAHAATSIIADAVTLLSGNWNDTISFTQPYNSANRPRPAQSWYRVAVIAGKGMGFAWPGGGADADFGTDGGAHNFLRYLESGQTLNYRGSIATFFFSRQAVGTYKGGTVYGAPVRAYQFDSDFLTPALLPPNTPVFRDLNAVGFSQELRPGK